MRKVSHWLCVLILSLPGLAIADTPTLDRLGELLESVHEINWAPYTRTPVEISSLRQQLQTYIDTVGAKSDTGPDEKRARQRAIAEHGKFATTENGSLAPDAYDFYKKLMDQASTSDDDSPERIALLRSLGNTGAAESVELVSDWVNPEYPITGYFALGTLDRIFAPELPKMDPRLDTPAGYSAPGLGKPLANRKNPEAWKQAAEKAGRRLKALAEKSGSDPDYSKRILRTAQVIGASHTSDGTSASTESHPEKLEAESPTAQAQTDAATVLDRKPASSEINPATDHSSAFPGWVLFLVGGVVLGAIVFFTIRRA